MRTFGPGIIHVPFGEAGACLLVIENFISADTASPSGGPAAIALLTVMDPVLAAWPLARPAEPATARCHS